MILRKRPHWSLFLLLGSAGCQQLIPVQNDGMQSSGVPAAVQERFTQYCATVGCHSGVTAPDLSAGNAASLLEGSSATGLPFVAFGDIQGSYLALKLLPDPPSGTIMPPPGSPPIPAEDVALILGWIAGAELGDAGGGGSSGGDDSGSPGSNADGATSNASSDPVGGTTTTPADSGGGEAQVCSLEAADPGAESPLDTGDGAGQIPTAVGDALLANCGCHYASAATAPLSALLGAGYQPMETLAHFRDAYVGINPGAYGAGSGADAIYARVVDQKNMPQLVLCDLGGGEVISPDDFALLEMWLDAGTPDGATF